MATQDNFQRLSDSPIAGVGKRRFTGSGSHQSSSLISDHGDTRYADAARLAACAGDGHLATPLRPAKSLRVLTYCLPRIHGSERAISETHITH